MNVLDQMHLVSQMFQCIIVQFAGQVPAREATRMFIDPPEVAKYNFPRFPSFLGRGELNRAFPYLLSFRCSCSCPIAASIYSYEKKETHRQNSAFPAVFN